MVIGATVFAGLILLLLLAERGSSQLWHGGHALAFYYCTPCDLRYPRDELGDLAELRCPRGHYVELTSDGIPFNTIFVSACVVFIAVASVLIATGKVT